jgi:hypothetical protein
LYLYRDASVEASQGEKEELRKLKKELEYLQSANKKRFEVHVVDGFSI